MEAPLASPLQTISLLESLADERRLRLLRLLERNELGVMELSDILQAPQSTISRHLKILQDNGWVRSRSEGTHHRYSTVLDDLSPAGRRLWLAAREQGDHWPIVAQDQLRLERCLRERSSSQRFFAGAAAQWDELRDKFYGRAFSTLACLSLLPGEFVVADLGCGTGQISAMLAPHVKQVIGVDNSPAMLKAARGRLVSTPNVDLRRGDLSSLPIESAGCDAALLVLALSYTHEPRDVLRELVRILKPGGKAVIVDLMAHDRDDFRRQMGQVYAGFESTAIERMMATIGFSRIQTRPLPPEQNVKGPALFQAVGSRNDN